MSTVSALANSVATIFSLDVYRRFWRANAGDAELITTGRIAAGAALVLAALTAPTVARIGLFKYFQTGVTYMATPFISGCCLACSGGGRATPEPSLALAAACSSK